jgi:hypothetical protein
MTCSGELFHRFKTKAASHSSPYSLNPFTRLPYLPFVYFRHCSSHERFREFGFEDWVRFHARRAEKGYANAIGKYYTEAREEG